MRAVVQRVTEASVSVDREVIGAISTGLLVLLGVEKADTQRDAQYLADKVVGLRVFDDEAGLMNLSVADVVGSVLVVSQFTLLGDVRRGKRPSFIDAAPPEIANSHYEGFCELLAASGIPIARGRFQADMQVHLVNDGPVTILLDSRKLF
jgi:D-aminoacyl-tRNA deacylase